MWVKISPTKDVNSSIFFAYELLRFFKENLENKSASAQQRALARKLKSLKEQVLKNKTELS